LCQYHLESILLISPVADLYLSFRLQECRPPSPQDAGIIIALRGGWDTHSSALGLQTQQKERKGRGGKETAF
jgi:hypothetical protein